MIDVEKIKAKREKLGLSQASAAEAAGFTRQRWNDIETGRKLNIEMATLEAIARVLKCRDKDLLT